MSFLRVLFTPGDRDLHEGNGHTLDDDENRALEMKGVQDGDNVVVPDAVSLVML